MTSQIQDLVVNDITTIPESNLISFNYARKTDVKVKLGTTTANLVQKTYLVDWEITTDNRVQLQANLFSATGTYKLQIYRETDPTTPVHEFQAGSSIRATDLNNVNKQTLYVAEETRDVVNSLAAGGSNISQLLIDGDNIADGSINSSKLSNPAVNTQDIVDIAVTTAKIANDAVTTDKLANSINTTIAGKANTGANLSTFTNDTNYITLAQVPLVTGMILMYTGSTAPSGWALCDGQNGTPDLRDRFIVGTGSTYSSGNTGGANTNTLTTSQLPSHTHTFSGSNTHNHSYSRLNSANDENGSPVGTGGSAGNNFGNRSTGNATITISGNTGSVGSGSSVENRPPYYALAFIMKT
jgi:microcystin-dependent protein